MGDSTVCKNKNSALSPKANTLFMSLCIENPTSFKQKVELVQTYHHIFRTLQTPKIKLTIQE